MTKLSPSGRTLVYSTYFGGSTSDTGYGIAVDAQGSAYVAGETVSRDFPLDQPPNCSCYEGEAVVVKFADTIGPAQGTETTPGVYVPIAETVRSFKEVIEGEHDDVPESAFLLKGSIDDVLAAAKTGA